MCLTIANNFITVIFLKYLIVILSQLGQRSGQIFFIINQEEIPLKLKTSSLLIAGALFGAAVLPAQANNDAMMDLLKVLRDQGTITSENYELLSNASKADAEVVEAVKNDLAAAKSDMPKITTEGKIKIESQDGNWSFQPIGRVMWDAVDTDSDGGAADVKGTELRRARLGFEGSVYDWGYKFEADFAGGDTSVKDAYISYGTKIGDMKAGVKLGQSHIPFGLNTKISSKYMTFMDRPMFADSSVSPARSSGAVASLAAKDYSWSLAAGLQSGGFSSDNGGDLYEVNGSTFAVRGSFLPFMQDKNHLVQIGAAFLNQGGGDKFDFKPDLVSHEDTYKPVSLSSSATEFDGANAFTIDALAVYGSFHAMAEYLDHTVEQENTGDIDTTAFAVEAGYFLTGESLKWKNGYTSGITPKSSSGAWQVAARFETLEIDPSLASESEYDKFTVGVNYYPTSNIRLMLNYDQVTDLTVNGAGSAIEPSALKFRAQAYW